MKKEVREEIENLAPNLLKTGNENPFSVPPKYFKELEISLESLKEKNQNVPLDYFKNLPEQVISKSKLDKPARIVSFNYKHWIAAASIAVFCITSYITLNTSNVSVENQAFVLDVELEEAFDYLAEQDDLYISEVIKLTDDEFFEDIEEELDEEDLDYILDEITLDDLDELL